MVGLLIISLGTTQLLVLVTFLIIYKQNKTIMKTQEEVATELVALKGQVEKIKGEITTKLQALADAIANQGNASPAVEAALADLKSSVQSADDLNADAPETPETPAE